MAFKIILFDFIFTILFSETDTFSIVTVFITSFRRFNFLHALLFLYVVYQLDLELWLCQISSFSKVLNLWLDLIIQTEHWKP